MSYESPIILEKAGVFLLSTIRSQTGALGWLRRLPAAEVETTPG